MSAGRAAWLAERRGSIGGSDAAASLAALLWGSYTPLADLAAALGCGAAGSIPYAWRDMPPAWYVRAVAEMGGSAEQETTTRHGS